MLKRQAVMTLLVLAIAVAAFAGEHPERWYQDRWCKENRGRSETVMPDGTRCDCETETHAVEFDFGRKWSEAIGQSLNYAMQTNKRAGIVLIIESPNDHRYWIRLNSIIQHYKLPISTCMMTPQSTGEKWPTK